MKIRLLKDADVSAVIRKHNEFLPHESATREQILRKLFFDVNFDRSGFFIAEENGEIVGFVNAVYHATAIARGAPNGYPNGYVNRLAIRDGEDFEEIGTALLTCAETYLREHGKTGISTGYFPTYFTQGVCPERAPRYVRLYEKLGYSSAASAALRLDLSRFVPFETYEERRRDLLAEGYAVGPLTEAYLLSAIDPKADFSNASWSAEFKMRLQQGFALEKMRVATKDGKVVGACIYGDPGSSEERFGPFGVSAGHRGKGIGAVLLQDCLTEMKKHGLQSAWMQWVGEDGVAFRLYRKFGFAKTATYLTFHKNLGENV